MKLTLDITKDFNELVDVGHFINAGEMKPYIFFDFPPKIENRMFTFEIMNFGFDVSSRSGLIEKQFKEKSSHFDDILHKRLMITGKAEFEIKNVKGIDIQLWDLKNKTRMYYSTDNYQIEKGDYLFEGGGYSEFSSSYIWLNVLADKNTKATITFSLGEYVELENDSPEFERYVSTLQTPYDYQTSSRYDADILKSFDNKVPRTLDFEYSQKYFSSTTAHGKGIYTTVAIESEGSKGPKIDSNYIKSYHLHNIRQFADGRNAKHLSPIEQRFWIEFHDWATDKLKERLNVIVAQNSELYDCILEQTKMRGRYAYLEIEQLIMEFLKKVFKQ